VRRAKRVQGSRHKLSADHQQRWRGQQWLFNAVNELDATMGLRLSAPNASHQTRQRLPVSALRVECAELAEAHVAIFDQLFGGPRQELCEPFTERLIE
jgi:hypothetical protein